MIEAPKDMEVRQVEMGISIIIGWIIVQDIKI